MDDEQLIVDNLLLVYHIYYSLGKTEFVKNNMDDIIGEGNYALVKAAQSFNPDKAKFVTYAARCIFNQMLMFLRRRKKDEICVSLFTTIGYDSSGHELLLLDILSDKTDFTFGVEEKITLCAFYNACPKREKQIIRCRLKGLTHNNIAKRLKFSQSYISRIISEMRKRYNNAAKKPGLKTNSTLCCGKGGGYEKRNSTF